MHKITSLYKMYKDHNLKPKSVQHGFTLIELMVVLSIIAVLASFVMSSLQSSRQKAYDAQIVSDMTQIRNALELYANDNNYVYPLVVNLASNQSQFAKTNANSISLNPASSIIKMLFANPLYADVGRDQNCEYFDNLSTVLVPKYIGSMPRHPFDDGVNVCYKYFATDSGDTAVAYGPLITETYSEGISKQAGIAVGKTDQESLQNICSANLESGTNLGEGASPFPFFSGGSDHCSGVIADTVIGITSGEGNVTVTSSCSLSQYNNQEDCESEHSYCTDPQYTDQVTCEFNGAYAQGTCNGGGEYTDESSCINAGYMSGEGCSGGWYPDESACVSAGFSSGYCDNSSYYDEVTCTSAGYYSGGGCSGNGYYDQYSCENAGYPSAGWCSTGGYYDQSTCESAGTIDGYCSGGGYTDESSCVSATCSSMAAYCSDGVSSTYEDCIANGFSWNDAQSSSCGYYWSPGSVGYGYQWYPGMITLFGYTWSEPTFASYGYQWHNNFYSYGYYWYPGNWSTYGYQWTPGTYTSNIWVNVPAGVWSVY